jgi:hypothetical protein
MCCYWRCNNAQAILSLRTHNLFFTLMRRDPNPDEPPVDIGVKISTYVVFHSKILSHHFDRKLTEKLTENQCFRQRITGLHTKLSNLNNRISVQLATIDGARNRIDINAKANTELLLKISDHNVNLAGELERVDGLRKKLHQLQTDVSFFISLFCFVLAF